MFKKLQGKRSVVGQFEIHRMGGVDEGWDFVSSAKGTAPKGRYCFNSAFTGGALSGCQNRCTENFSLLAK